MLFNKLYNWMFCFELYIHWLKLKHWRTNDNALEDHSRYTSTQPMSSATKRSHNISPGMLQFWGLVRLSTQLVSIWIWLRVKNPYSSVCISCLAGWPGMDLDMKWDSFWWRGCYDVDFWMSENRFWKLMW